MSSGNKKPSSSGWLFLFSLSTYAPLTPPQPLPSEIDAGCCREWGCPSCFTPGEGSGWEDVYWEGFWTGSGNGYKIPIGGASGVLSTGPSIAWYHDMLAKPTFHIMFYNYNTIGGNSLPIEERHPFSRDRRYFSPQDVVLDIVFHSVFMYLGRTELKE